MAAENAENAGKLYHEDTKIPKNDWFTAENALKRGKHMRRSSTDAAHSNFMNLN